MAENNFSTTQTAEAREELQKIDLFHMIKDMLKGLKAFWWLPILLFVIAAGRKYLTADRSFYPVYETSGTVYVSMAEGSDSYQNMLTAEQMSDLFPYMMSNGLLSNAVLEKLGTETLPGSVSLSVDGYTNLMTIRVTGDDPQAIHDMLLAVIEVYPELLEFIVGPTEFTLFKDMGVPTEPSNSAPNNVSIAKRAVKGAMKYFLAGLALILLYGLTIRSISTRDEMKQYLNAPCIGSLPSVKLKKRAKGKAKQLTMDNDSVPYGFLESVRMIRTRFEREMSQKGRRVALVTSTIPGEGKTTLAVNLALSLAQSGKKTLLIDGDMRNPSVENALGLSEASGLSQILKGEASVRDCIVRTPESGLYVLSAGKNAKNSTDLISGENMHKLIQEVRQYAEYIIIDTPPSMVLGDSIAAGKYADGCIFVVRAGHARRGMVMEGFGQMAENGCGIIGTVLNDDKDSLSSYGSSYGKYGGYGAYGKYGRYGSSYSGYYGNRKKSKDK